MSALKRLLTCTNQAISQLGSLIGTLGMNPKVKLLQPAISVMHPTRIENLETLGEKLDNITKLKKMLHHLCRGVAMHIFV